MGLQGALIVVRLCVVLAVAFLLAACESTPTGPAEQVEASTAPGYEIVSTEDVSYAVVRRLTARVSLIQHYARQTVEDIARDIVAELIDSQDVNAITIFFYGPGTSTASAYDVARVEWAPNGVWADAHTVQAGDYSSFAYSVSYNEPLPASTTTLSVSNQTGLLGVPLPEGATLLERDAGDPSAGRDASECYAVSAPAADIAAFFDGEMRGTGWLKDGVSTEYALFWRKGDIRFVVVISSEGGTFTLMGS